MSEGTTRRWARPLALVAALAGITLAVVLWLAAGRRYGDAVADLAPAPVGCDTTLQFERTGTYTFFLETTGRVGDLDGDCESDDRTYQLDPDQLPRVRLTLVDASGQELDLDRADGPTYDRDGSAGGAFRRVAINEAGEYVLTVESASTDVVVRVGQDPTDGVAALRVGALLALITGLGLAVLAVVLGRARPVPPTPAPAALWPTLPVPRPVAPPVAPPPTPPYGTAPAATSERPLPAPPRPTPPAAPTPRPGGPLPPPTPRRPVGGR